MGMAARPAIGAGLGLVGSLFGGQGRPQEYRETPFQQQMGGWLMNQLQQGQTQMSPEMLAQMQQAYAVPQSAQWAMGLLPGMFGGGGGGFGMGGGMPQGMQGAGMGASGMGFPQQMPQQMPPQAYGGGGFGMPRAGFGMNPFAM